MLYTPFFRLCVAPLYERERSSRFLDVLGVRHTRGLENTHVEIGVSAFLSLSHSLFPRFHFFFFNLPLFPFCSSPFAPVICSRRRSVPREIRNDLLISGLNFTTPRCDRSADWRWGVAETKRTQKSSLPPPFTARHEEKDTEKSRRLLWCERLIQSLISAVTPRRA